MCACVLCSYFSGLGEGRREREKNTLKSERVRGGNAYHGNAERGGAHTWQTRKCAAVLRPDKNPSQGAARMRRVSFAMFRLFRIVFLCVILLHIIIVYYSQQRRARVNHLAPIYRSHA